MTVTITTSSVPVVKNALEALFTEALASASDTGDQVQVAQGQARQPEQERVEVGGAQGRADALTMGGTAGRREEIYAVEVLISSESPGLSQHEVTSRVFELLALLEATVRDDPELGLVPGSFDEMDCQAGEFEDRQWVTEEGYGAAVIWHVEIRTAI